MKKEMIHDIGYTPDITEEPNWNEISVNIPYSPNNEEIGLIRGKTIAELYLNGEISISEQPSQEMLNLWKEVSKTIKVNRNQSHPFIIKIQIGNETNKQSEQ